MTVQGVLGGPLIVLIIVLSSFWFGREPLDYFQTQIYRPAVEAWTEAHNEHLKRLSQVSREEKVCYLNGGSWDTCNACCVSGLFFLCTTIVLERGTRVLAPLPSQAKPDMQKCERVGKF